jgi:hypothetical protein
MGPVSGALVFGGMRNEKGRVDCGGSPYNVMHFGSRIRFMDDLLLERWAKGNKNGVYRWSALSGYSARV